MTEKSETKFCFTCGNALQQIPRTYGYDGETGEPLITIDLRCDKTKFFTLRSHPLTRAEASVNFLCGM